MLPIKGNILFSTQTTFRNLSFLIFLYFIVGLTSSIFILMQRWRIACCKVWVYKQSWKIRKLLQRRMNKSSGTAKKLLDIIHFLNPILPNLCKAVRVKRKKCPLLACFFFCVLKLSYSGVKEKLIRERERQAQV